MPLFGDPAASQHRLCDPKSDQQQHHALRALHQRRPRRRTVQAQLHNGPASRRLELCDALITKTTAAKHNVTSPALITI